MLTMRFSKKVFYLFSIKQKSVLSDEIQQKMSYLTGGLN